MQAQCMSVGCTKNAKFYCCQPEQPVCIDCTKLTCPRCNKRPNRPALTRKVSVPASGPQKCIKCNQNIANQSLNFTCGHRLCPLCVCSSTCQLIKTQKWQEFIPPQKQILQCSCKKSSSSIAQILQKYCFCCGNVFGKDSARVKLKNGLFIRNSCKITLKHSDDLGQSSCLLSPRNLKSLLMVPEPSVLLIDQDMKEIDKDGNPEIFDSGGTDLQNVKAIVGAENNCLANNGLKDDFAVQQILPAEIKPLQKAYNGMQMSIYSMSSNSSSVKSKFSNRESKNEMPCKGCSKFFTKWRSTNSPALCRKCFSKTQNHIQDSDSSFPGSHLGAESRSKMVEPKQLIWFPNSSDKESSLQCSNCNQMTNDRPIPAGISESGSYLCKDCLQLGRVSKSNCSDNKSNFEHYRQYLKKRQQFQTFGANRSLTTVITESNSHVVLSRQQPMLLSVYQEFADPVELKMQANKYNQTSCFICGLFVPISQLLGEGPYLCLSCFLDQTASTQ